MTIPSRNRILRNDYFGVPGYDAGRKVPVALVTGGARGIGRAIALALAEDGYRVVLNYLSSGSEAERLVRDRPNVALAVRADVSDAGQAEEMIARIRGELGRLDAVVSNAGITIDRLLLRQTEQEWDRVIGTNLKGCFNVLRASVPLMIESGGGHIVNISSHSGVKGSAGQAAYSASKAAILGLSATAARELGASGIRVNVVLPGYVETDMGGRAAGALEGAKKKSIIGTSASAEETAEIIRTLLKTRRITGQVFSLDSRIL